MRGWAVALPWASVEPTAVVTVLTVLPSALSVSVVMLVAPCLPVTVWVSGSP